MPVSALTVILEGGGKNFGPGDQLKLSLGLANSSDPVTVDAYLALNLPDKSLVFFQFGEGGSLIPSMGSIDPTTWKKLLSDVLIDKGVFTGSVLVLDYTLTGSEPTGTYQWILAFMNAGTLKLINYKVDPFLIGPYPLANVLGNWSGSWTNQTFTSSGPVTFGIVDSFPGVVTISVDLGGNVFGALDPPPFMVDAAIMQTVKTFHFFVRHQP